MSENRPNRSSRPARPDARKGAPSPRSAAGPKPAAHSGSSPLRLHATAAPNAGSAAWMTRAAWGVMALHGLLVLAIQVRLHPVGDVFTETDFYGAYALGARALQQGHLDPSRYAVIGPVYEMTLALAGFVAPNLFVAAAALSLLASLGTLWAWHRLLSARTNPALALVATLLLAINGQFLRYSWSVTTDALAMALQAFSLWLLLGLRADERPAAPRRMALAGALAALAFLTRYSAVALLPAGLLAALAGWTNLPREQRVAGALAFAAGFAALVLPWVGISLASGAHFAFQLHHNIAYEVFARARGIPWDTYQREMQPQFPTPWSVLARDPGAVASRMLFNVGDHLRLDALKVAGAPLAIAAALGLVFAWRDGLLARLTPLLATAALLFLMLVPAFHSERYSLPLLPVWAALAAAAFASPRFALALDAGAGRTVWLKAALLALPLALAARSSLALHQRSLGILPVEVLEVARAVKPFQRPGDKVMARKPHFAWHAGMTAVPFPFADSLSQVAAAARAQGVRWLYFSWPEAEMRPAVSFLLDTASHVPGLRVRAVTRQNPAVLYEIEPGFGAEPAWAGDPATATLHRARAQALINRTDWRSRVYVALHERSLGRWAEAQVLLDEAFAYAPEDPDMVLLAADNLTRLEHLAAARAMYARADRLAPGDPRIAVGRGWLAALEGDDAGAARWWRDVIATSGDARTLLRMRQAFSTTHDATSLALVEQRLAELGARP